MNNKDYLNKLISIRTDMSSVSNIEYVDYVCNILKNNNIKSVRIKNPDGISENIVAGINCELKNLKDAIVLSGHIDTVMANEKMWNTSPYILTMNDTKAYGLGVADMKNFTANVLANISKLQNASQSRPLLLCLSSDEETTLFGIKQIIKYFKQNNIQTNYVIVGEPNSSKICDCNKGFYEMELSVTGKACHSSAPSNGINAIYIMSKIICELEKISKSFETDTTLNVGIINGGNLCNVVPNNCTIRFEMRTYDSEEVKNVCAKIEKTFNNLKSEYAGCEISNSLVFEIPAFTKRENDYQNRIMEYLDTTSYSYRASTEAGFFQELGANCIIFGVGDIKFAHSANEEIDLKEFDDYQQKLVEIVKLLND